MSGFRFHQSSALCRIPANLTHSTQRVMYGSLFPLIDSRADPFAPAADGCIPPTAAMRRSFGNYAKAAKLPFATDRVMISIGWKWVRGLGLQNVCSNSLPENLKFCRGRLRIPPAPRPGVGRGSDRPGVVGSLAGECLGGGIGAPAGA